MYLPDIKEMERRLTFAINHNTCKNMSEYYRDDKKKSKFWGKTAGNILEAYNKDKEWGER